MSKTSKVSKTCNMSKTFKMHKKRQITTSKNVRILDK
jgi:hypothetical protein